MVRIHGLYARSLKNKKQKVHFLLNKVRKKDHRHLTKVNH